MECVMMTAPVKAHATEEAVSGEKETVGMIMTVGRSVATGRITTAGWTADLGRSKAAGPTGTAGVVTAGGDSRVTRVGTTGVPQRSTLGLALPPLARRSDVRRNDLQWKIGSKRHRTAVGRRSHGPQVCR